MYFIIYRVIIFFITSLKYFLQPLPGYDSEAYSDENLSPQNKPC
ncbi:hypothetical protein SHVI106290_00200 [Shewanella violacea]